MTYRLIYAASGRPCVDTFENTGEAVTRACALFSHGYNAAIMLENADGDLVAGDDELRAFCRKRRASTSDAA